MKPLGFGVIGARSFVAEAAVLPALSASTSCELMAAASRSGDIDPRWAETTVDSYEDVLNHPDVEAVYLPLPNHLHLEWIKRCAAAGKHVLCEKPLALTASDARLAADICDAAGVMCAEAWMTPFHKRWQFMMLHATSGDLGAVQSVNTVFSFDMEIGDGTNYRLNPTMGGGAFNDVGIYCLGPAVKLWGAEPDTVEIIHLNVVDSTDRTVSFHLGWNDGRSAYGTCSFEKSEQQSIDITCENGSITAVNNAHTGGTNSSDFSWQRDDDGDINVVPIPSNDPYQTMVERFAAAVRGERDWPRPMNDVIAMTKLMDRIRAEI